MIITGGLSIQMVVLALLTVRSVLDRVWFPDYHVDESSFCLAPSLPLKLILRCLVPEFTPPTLLNWPTCVKHCRFLVLVVLSLMVNSHLFWWLYTCCWQWSGHELGPNTRPARAGMSTIYDPCSAQATAHHAARAWSRWKIGLTNALTMPLHAAHLDLSPTTAIPHAGLVVTLTPLSVLMAVITSMQHIRTNAATLHQDRVQRWFFSSWPLCLLCTSCVFCIVVFFRSRVFVLSGSLLSPQVMDRLFIRVYCIEYQRLLRAQYVEPPLDLLFLEQVNDIFDFSFGNRPSHIAFSCHFSHDLLWYKEEVFVSVRWYIRHHCPWNSFSGVAPLPPLWHRRAGEQSRLSYQSVCRKGLRHSSSLVRELDELVSMFPYAGAERFTSFLWRRDPVLCLV